MGYILPISLHQYEQYQYRMIEGKEGNYFIDKTHKVAFHTTKAMLNEKEEEELADSEEEQMYQAIRKPAEAFQIAPADRVALTGKGGNINVSI